MDVYKNQIERPRRDACALNVEVLFLAIHGARERGCCCMGPASLQTRQHVTSLLVHALVDGLVVHISATWRERCDMLLGRSS